MMNEFIESMQIIGERLARQIRQSWDENIWPGIQQSAQTEIARLRYRQFEAEQREREFSANKGSEESNNEEA